MVTIGIDLSIVGKHRAAVQADSDESDGKLIRFSTDPTDLDRLVRRARQGVSEDEPVQVVMEPTGAAWLPIASYLSQRGIKVYLVGTQKVAALRRFYSRHAKSDRVDARLLARMPGIMPDTLYELRLASAELQMGQRWCKQQEGLSKLITAVKNRVRAWERTFWPGLEDEVGDLFSPWMVRWRQEWYDPWKLRAADPAELGTFLLSAGAQDEDVDRLVKGLKRVAQRTVGLYATPEGDHSPHVDYTAFQDQVLRELRLLKYYEAEHKEVRCKVQQAYRRVHPTRYLETIYGVGKDGAAVYAFFAFDVDRFEDQKAFRSWSGMVPASAQSGQSEQKGLRITCAGPSLVKKYLYINAEIARQWDPQIAAIYYDQMVHKGKHHCQSVCHCATHLLDRVRAVLRDNRPYELRDVDGRVVTWQQARAIITDRYHVTEDVRRRSRRGARKERIEAKLERKRKRGRRSHPAWQEASVSALPQSGLAPPT